MTRGRHAAASRRAGRPGGLLLAAAGALTVLAGVTGLALAAHSGRGAYPSGPIPHVAVPRGRAAALASSSRHRPVPRPLFLYIPAIGVRTALVRLGTTSAGALQAPETTQVAGWFTGSARPGAIGPAVIAGHVDSRLGPGVFFRLRLLRPGDKVFVLRADGSVAQFVITAVRKYAKARFPTAAVYGPVPYSAIRLITCGGLFDYATGHYLSNVVAYGRQIGPGGREASKK